MYERIAEDLERVTKLIEQVRDYIEFAKESGIDVSAYETELEELEEKKRRLEEALKSRLKKK